MTSVTLSFDYEPFFNDGYLDVETHLINKTNRILAQLTLKTRNIFFVDVNFLMFAERYNVSFDLIISQLEVILDKGFEIGLHIHPHWIDAKYHNGKVIHNFKRFSLRDFNDTDVIDLVSKSFLFLQRFLPDARVISFRAGGLILPLGNTLYETLSKNGIYEEHSVVPGYYGTNAGRMIDFREYAASGPFELNRLDTDQTMICWPISTYEKNLFQKFKYFILGPSNSRISSECPVALGLEGTIPYNNKRFFTCDYIHPKLFSKVFKKHVEKERYLSIINHPKDFSEFTLLNINTVNAHV